jgi:hypothetical protein
MATSGRLVPRRMLIACDGGIVGMWIMGNNYRVADCTRPMAVRFETSSVAAAFTEAVLTKCSIGASAPWRAPARTGWKYYAGRKRPSHSAACAHILRFALLLLKCHFGKASELAGMQPFECLRLQLLEGRQADLKMLVDALPVELPGHAGELDLAMQRFVRDAK